MRALLVTGSDTGVGKTHVTGVIAGALHQAGTPVQIVKVIETGVSPGQPGDAIAAAGGLDNLTPFTLFTFRAPLAPATAAAQEGQVISFETVLAACRTLPKVDSGVRIYEGAGGIASPLDNQGHDWADFAAAIGVDAVLIVVPDRLGAIGQSRLCLARAAALGLRASVWLNSPMPPPADVARSTRETLRALKANLMGAAELPAWLEASEQAAPSQQSSASPSLPASSPLLTRIDNDLAERQQRHRRRELRVTSPEPSLLNLADNDYLELSRDPALIAASSAAAARYGTSASASPLITGWTTAHEDLTQALCAWLSFPFGLLWTSGYAANGAVLGTLPQKGDLILADRLVHASMIAGLTRSGARFKRYRHLDLDHLEAELADRPAKGGTVFVATETVFSMDGDYPDLARLARLKRAHGFVLIVDEAHGLGWYGPKGTGLVGEAGIAADVDILVGTLGKALGAGGAFTLFRDARLRDHLINHAGEFIYSTAAPPPAMAAAQAAIGRVADLASEQRSWRDESSRFRTRLRKAGWNVPDGDSPIVPVLLGDEFAALAAAQELRKDGILAGAVRPPTVPAGTSRLRFSLKRSFNSAAAERIVNSLSPFLIGGVGESRGDEGVAGAPRSAHVETEAGVPRKISHSVANDPSPQKSPARYAWVMGWAVPPAWFEALVRSAFPDDEHCFISAASRYREELERLGPCDVVVGYSLGSLLLLLAAEEGWSPGTADVVLAAPIWRFPARAALRALQRQLRADPAAALFGFYHSTGLDDAAAFPPPPLEDLIWGLDQLDQRSAAPRLPAGWRAIIGEGDRLLSAQALKAEIPQVQIVPGDHHPRGLLAALRPIAVP